jgi:hypothetical protein
MALEFLPLHEVVDVTPIAPERVVPPSGGLNTNTNTVPGCASGTESLTCEGETIVVNLHGALLSTTIRLSVGMRISIHVYMTDKRAKARVVYADPENPLRCGIELTRWRRWLCRRLSPDTTAPPF